MPKISVIMPLYNAEKYVENAIESILNQTFQDFELIVIDDGSTDSGMDIVQNIHDSRIRLFYNEKNEGIAYTRNRGLELAQGEYIALMDDDDIAGVNRLEVEKQFLDDNSDIDVVGANLSVINDKGEIIYTNAEPLNNPYYIQAYLLLNNPMANGSTLIRKEFIEKNNIRYSDNCCGMEDYKFWVECSINGKLTNLNKVFLYWRNRENNTTNTITSQTPKLREIKWAEISRYALEKNGYELTDNEYDLVFKMLLGNISMNVATKDEMEKLYLIMKKIINQAKKNNVRNYKEVSIFCKKMFSRRLEFSQFW